MSARMKGILLANIAMDMVSDPESSAAEQYANALCVLSSAIIDLAHHNATPEAVLAKIGNALLAHKCDEDSGEGVSNV